jgi:hypothetical protein
LYHDERGGGQSDEERRKIISLFINLEIKNICRGEKKKNLH